MRVAVSPTLRIAAGFLLAALAGAIGYHVLHQRERGTPEALLERADEMSWLNSWIAATPLYHQAELECLQEHDLSKALYARVSQVPAQSESSVSFPAQIASLTKDLSLPEAKEPETRLRILTILGMLEVNYDADMARSTWAQVETLARQQHHYLLASRAIGEQGIAAFLLGDIRTAKKDVIEAWTVAKVADPAARVRYASVYGAGLVELQKYQEALGPLNEAIRVAEKTHGVAYPTIAITSKIEALGGLGRTQEALALATEAMQRVTAYHLAGHLFELYQTRAGIYERKGLSAKCPGFAVRFVCDCFRSDPGLVYAVLYIQMRFSWNEPKSRSNQRKHGISFDTATQVFLDPLYISRLDRIAEGEERWQTIGMVNGVLLILVAYTVIDEEEELIRIISARRVTRQERIEYEEASEI